MAKLWVTEEECDRGDFPPVCAVCGDEADRVDRHTFRWQPGWLVVLVLLGLLGIVLYIVLAVTLGKTMRMPVPLCHRHAGHWRNHKLAVWLWLLAAVGLLVAGLTMLGDRENADLGFSLRVAAGVFFLVGLVAVAIWQRALVQAARITDDDMQLTGVSRAFADAVKDERRAERQERAERRRLRDAKEGRPRRRDEDDGGYDDDDRR